VHMRWQQLLSHRKPWMTKALILWPGMYFHMGLSKAWFILPIGN